VTTANNTRKPDWLRKELPPGAEVGRTERLLEELDMATVCSSARCPNRCECFDRRTATFMILGDRCTRNCTFCAVAKGPTLPVKAEEAPRVAEAADRLGLRHVVITSVTRDDLPDGGASHFAATIAFVRARLSEATIEVLTPDFGGSIDALDAVLAARPDVFNHNIETVRRLYTQVRPQADYRRSLVVLAYAAEHGACTKSGLMVGLGETDAEIVAAMSDLRQAGCQILTLGQYLQPTSDHLPVSRYVEPAQFEAWRREGLAMGFAAVHAGPFVRSSYRAAELLADRRPQ